ncbi:PAS domain S-box-containing protein/diguanylate cyclase (GGDEF)-like protein [Melghiribacillus thermohalophilus]|uniref:PAS domain S-box-containing protein/diguanylate cyclase (GGDEF)-like protein n=1 Tax=Melghiribacillus thermohalophilus TaxID=1324956 RepID=A0A4R3MWJ7_9BACI|nr:EAL domain-containing protein [Melghiribacillus thermohalophilus]TCT18284.1 PAS domain S-box-containing protein/diguanylate cyclase (GGDEF)-like protein [Melghiribacillus thermohalophilus]
MKGLRVSLHEQERTFLAVVGVGLSFFLFFFYLKDSIFFAIETRHYLSLHTILEFISIAIAISIAIQGWMIFPHQSSRYRIFIASTFLAVGILDLLHTLFYNGMPGLFTFESSVQKATWFWITARLTQAVFLFIIIALPNKNVSRPFKPVLFMLSLLYILGWSILIIQYEHQLPILVHEGAGTTPLKNTLEYAVNILHLLTIVVLFQHYRTSRKKSHLDLILALSFLFIGEIVFTTYLSVYDFQNFLGHLYKVIGYVYFMKGIYVATIKEPYDIQKKTEEALRKNEKQLKTITASLGEGVVVLDQEYRTIFINPEAERLLGYNRGELMGKQLHNQIYQHIKGSQISLVADECPIHQTIKHKKAHRIEDDYFIKKDGSKLPVAYVVSPMIEHGNVLGTVIVFQDITERKKYHEKITYQANHDALTELPNRRYFIERLKKDLVQVKSENSSLGIFYLDIDNFKNINDSMGHLIGDKLLQEVARRLQAIHPDQFVARLSGDEFAILYTGNPSRVKHEARKTITAFQKPFILEKKEVYVTTSLGISLYPYDGDDEMTLIRHADMAMYQAKNKGKNQFSIYTTKLKEERLWSTRIEQLLHNAVENHEIKLNYQPIINLETEEIERLEALARWDHPELGYIPPGEFIPIAEENGLIIPIGQQLFKQACEQLTNLHQKGYTSIQMNLNLSLLQLQHPDFISFVKALLKQYKLCSKDFELEITENIALSNDEMVIQTIQSLKSLGFRIAIDDFGRGYSSVGYLRTITVDTLKIDKSYIWDVNDDEQTARLTAAIISLARTMGLEIVAEGVETEEHLEFLKTHSCHWAQGYYYAPPVGKELIETLLERGVTWKKQMEY